MSGPVKFSYTMFVSSSEILYFFDRAETARDEHDTDSFSVPDGLRIRVGIDGLPDGKRVDRLSELASDKLSIRLSAFVSLVRYYFVIYLLRFHAKPTKVVLNHKHPPKFVKFRSASGRALQVSCESGRLSPIGVLLDVLLIVTETVNFVLSIDSLLGQGGMLERGNPYAIYVYIPLSKLN